MKIKGKKKKKIIEEWKKKIEEKNRSTKKWRRKNKTGEKIIAKKKKRRTQYLSGSYLAAQRSASSVALVGNSCGHKCLSGFGCSKVSEFSGSFNVGIWVPR